MEKGEKQVRKIGIVMAAAFATTLSGCGPSLDLAEDQQRFVELVAESKDAYKDADNSIQEKRARQERSEALCKYFDGEYGVQGWKGEVAAIRTTMTDHAGIEVLIAKNLTLKTASTSLTFGSDTQKTLIDSETPLFDTVAGLKEGDRIEFDGRFLAGSEKDCLKEVSLTESGSMRMPEFMFHFGGIEKKG